MSLFNATTYLPDAERLSNTTGEDMVGQPCPTCGSPLVIRTRKRDRKQFVACDKSKRLRCPFTIGMYETLRQRTKRVHNELWEKSTERMHEAALAGIHDSW